MERRKLSVRFLLFLGCVVSWLQAASSDVKFYESFDEAFEGRWTVLEKEDYQGVWKREKSEGHDDYGLLVSEKARKYAIVKELDDEPLELKDKTVVLQFETRLQNGLECGGAYLKYLRPQSADWNPKEFDNETPYAIMFGPDRCGATNKVHFILKHLNPKTGEYVEHHLKFPPSVPSDKLTHVYTAILKPDNEVIILVDGEEKKKANFLSADEDFEPPLIPAKTIPDPDDQKPEDWDERPEIPDPEAKKPEDWDEEDAPIDKPEGWLDDEPEEVDDPEATKKPHEDWDDEEDGEWEAPPKVDNPKCAEAPGCGEWKRPTIRNPAYKGKWHAPMNDNPDQYKGIWKPKEIPNPDYFELEKPNFDPIAAVSIEIWTMQDGILFDNILITTSDKEAASYRATTWKPKFEAEKKEKEKSDLEEASSDSGALLNLKGFQKKIFDILYKVADLPFLGEHNKFKVLDLIEKAEKQPNLTISFVIVSTIVIIFISNGSDRCFMDAAASSSIREVESLLNYKFKTKKLLQDALTHPSYTTASASDSYQRLEWLGDNAIALIVSGYVFRTYPDAEAGEMSLIRSANVRTEKLARVAVKHGFYKYLRPDAVALDPLIRDFVEAVEKEEDGEELYGGMVKAPKVLADIVESIAAAIYVDCGMNVEKLWMSFRRLMEPFVTLDMVQQQPQPVTLLFQLCQKEGKQIKIEHERKGDKTITSVWVDGILLASASSNQKEHAKLKAAKIALEKLLQESVTMNDMDINDDENGKVGGKKRLKVSTDVMKDHKQSDKMECSKKG